MSQGYAGQRRNGKVLIAIVGGHAALLAALIFIKMEMPEKIRIPPMITENIPLEPPPKEIPPPPDRKPEVEPQPMQRSVIDVVKPPIPIPSEGPVIATVPFEDVVINTGPIGENTVVADPPVIPRPEPAPEPEPEPIMITPTKLVPRGNPASWVTNDDYPAAALRSEEQGRTRFSLTVAADGRPSACTVTSSSGSSTLDNAACRLLMRRAKFVPGKDSDGNATGGVYTNSFNWQIPED